MSILFFVIFFLCTSCGFKDMFLFFLYIFFPLRDGATFLPLEPELDLVTSGDLLLANRSKVLECHLWDEENSQEEASASLLGFLSPSLSSSLPLLFSLSHVSLWGTSSQVLGAALWRGPCGKELKSPTNNHITELRSRLDFQPLQMI